MRNRHVERLDRTGRRRQSGYGYLLVLAMIAVVGWQAARTTELWRVESRREREEEMVFAGHQIQRAIRQYFENGPQPGCFPTSLNTLYETRNAFGQRLLRKRFADPLVSDGQWGKIEDDDGRLRGVYSLADGHPLMTSPLRRGRSITSDAVSYGEWRFVHRPGAQTVLPPHMCRG